MEPAIVLSNYPSHDLATNTPRASKRGRLNKPASRPLPRNLKSGATNCCNRGGNVFLIIFNTRHALLLPGGRFWSPRNGRGEGTEQPHAVMDSWPQTRQFHERGQATSRARTQTIRVREQSVNTFSPRPPARQQTVRSRDLATSFAVRKRELPADTNCPQTVPRLELSISTTSSLTVVHELRQGEYHPRRSIAVSVSPLTSLPVHIRIIPAYDLI